MAKILIVDDSTDLADFLFTLLQLKDFEAEIATNKKELLAKLYSFQPDLILLDVVLRHTDGRKLCKEIKSNPLFSNIPIILLSAKPDLLKDYDECEADDVIEKPFDIQKIVDKINKNLKVP